MTATWDSFLERSVLEFPKLKVVAWDNHWILKYFHRAGWGGITLYNTVFMNSDDIETDRGVETLKHEMAHVRDQHSWGILFLLSYIFILPTVFTMRAFWEWRGYKETLRSIHDEYKHYKDTDPEYYKYITEYYCQWVTMQFTGVGYLYMFPFKNRMYNKCKMFIQSLS
jgi:hypothetical protein